MSKEPFFDKSGNTGLKHLANATRFSLQGLVSAAKREAAFRQELAIFMVLLPFAAWIADSLIEFTLLIAVGLLVLMVELLNSAIEALVDRMGEEHHPMAGLAKDYGSAAVMVSLAIALVVWVSALLQRIGG